MKLRRPHDALGGCIWLPRFIDKARHHLAGTLAKDYQGAFCNPLGIDGVFLGHFAVKRDEILDMLRREANDEAVGQWFVSRPDASPEKIRLWNELAPNIGSPGFPGERMFKWTMKHIYPGCSDVRVTTIFRAIAWDEGYLDEVCT